MTATTQHCFRLHRTDSGLDLRLERAPVREPEPAEVLVRVVATSLNRRDLMIRRGTYPTSDRPSVVPLSDGAGEVVRVGPGASRVRVGDRVAGTFFQCWTDGRRPADAIARALGGGVDGMLTEYVTLPERGLVRIPYHLSFEQGATLPCAAVTAWSGLVTHGRVRPGDYVLLLGTGGVSIFGLQFACALGARPIVLSSRADKRERACSLGAMAAIDYRSEPQWAAHVLAATHGAGVQQVLEVGGAATLPQSLEVLGPSGHIAVIGALSGRFAGEIPVMELLIKQAGVTGITVGSTAEFEAMNHCITEHRIEPIIDRTFAFAEIEKAFAYLESDAHFGKIVIRH